MAQPCAPRSPLPATRYPPPGNTPPLAPVSRAEGKTPPAEETVTAPPDTRQGARDEAFEQEALPWLDDVYRFALSMTRDEADAEDVVQDTFLRAYRSWNTYAVGSDCRRWLFTICRNAFLRARERERQTIELREGERDALATGAVSFYEGPPNGLEDILSRTDLLPAIESAL